MISSQLLKKSPTRLGMLGIAMAMGASLGLKPAHALTPAGSTINNQALGVYTDGSGIAQNVTSNEVQTVVQPVAFLSVASDGTRNGTIGSTVNFPHTITNTGNSADSFNLTVADLSGDDFQALPTLRADANGDGIPDGILPITKTPTLQPGESYSFVVTGLVSPLASNGQNAKIRVGATSAFDSTVSGTNTDTLIVSNNALVTVVKSIDKNSGTPGSGPYTYTLTYTNSGNTAATNLTITDLLPLGMSYVPGSGRWSGSGSAMTDAVGGDGTGVNYNYGAVPLTVGATIANIPANSSGKLTFQTTIDSGILPKILPNVALYTYNDGLSVISLTPTNTVNLAITQLAGFTFTGDTAATANQGGSVVFSNVLKNTGSGPDTFDITLAPNTFPLGTTFQLLKTSNSDLSDSSLIPLTDTNGNGIPDTGSLDPNQSFTVVLRAKLPTLAVGTGPYTINKIATSSVDPLVIHTATDTLTSITANTVDLTNDLAGTLGAGQGPEATPVTTLIGAAGSIQHFSLYVKNTGSVADSFVLLGAPTTNFGDLTLPDGLTLTFTNDAGTILTNTGLIQPGQTVKVNANVFLPLGLIPHTQNLYFRVQSLLTGAFDTKLDAVQIAGLRSIAITPNGVGQVYPGNAVVYPHTLSNTGNLPEGGATSTVTLGTADAVSGFTSVVYLDANNNGTLDSTDPIVTNLNNATALAPGQSLKLFVKVYAAAGTDLGAVNATTLTATTTGGIGTVPPVITLKDSTTVIAGQIQMQKTQALDTGGTLNYSVQRITTGAKPGAVIRYRIVATNVGTATATGFTISDSTPPFTVYDKGDGTTGAKGVASWYDGTTYHAADVTLVDGTSGTLKFNVGSLAPGASVTVTFGVRIQ